MIELKVFSFGVQKPKRKCYMDQNLSSFVGSSLTLTQEAGWGECSQLSARGQGGSPWRQQTNQFVLCTLHI